MGAPKVASKEKRHYCREHSTDEKPVEVKAVMYMPGRRIRFQCPQGCDIPKGQTILQ